MTLPRQHPFNSRNHYWNSKVLKGALRAAFHHKFAAPWEVCFAGHKALLDTWTVAEVFEFPVPWTLAWGCCCHRVVSPSQKSHLQKVIYSYFVKLPQIFPLMTICRVFFLFFFLQGILSLFLSLSKKLSHYFRAGKWTWNLCLEILQVIVFPAPEIS